VTTTPGAGLTQDKDRCMNVVASEESDPFNAQVIPFEGLIIRPRKKGAPSPSSM